jgi:hypothetical protein
VPAVFTYVDDLEHWLGNKARAWRRRKQPAKPREPELTS